MEIESIYRLVYDYFETAPISVDAQMKRIKSYQSKGEQGKAAIAALVLARISRRWESFYDFYLLTYRKDRFKGLEEEIGKEIKRGFFTKDVVFNGKELEIVS